MDLLRFSPYEIDLTYTPFIDTTIIIYKIELPPAGKTISINLLDDEYFTIPYVIYKIPNSTAGHQLLTQAKKNVWIIAINVEEPIIAQYVIDELHFYNTQYGKYMVKIILCRKKIYQLTYLEGVLVICP